VFPDSVKLASVRGECDKNGVWEVVEKVKTGDHVALFYRTKKEQFASVIPYIQIGLQRKERCLYVVDNNSVAMILSKLAEAGVDVDLAQDRGALRIVTKRDTYLRQGIFEPARMIEDLRRDVEESLRLGFTAFRATGEMTWALDLPNSLFRLMEYEANLHAQFPNKFVGLCQYDETRFPREIVSDMIQIHPKIIARGQLVQHPHYRPQWRAEDRRGQTLRLEELVAC
jgi:hypothetical protein